FRPPPTSTLFPYTTLFRSLPVPGPPVRTVILRVRAACTALCCTSERATLFFSVRPARYETQFVFSMRFCSIDCTSLSVLRQTTRSEEHTSELQSRENLVCR